MYAPTAHNRTVYASPPLAARLHKNAVGALPLLCVFSLPHFFVPVIMLRSFLYRAQKNVSYRQTLCENILPHVYSSLRAVMARGFIPKKIFKEERRRNKILRVAFLLLLFFSDLRRTFGLKANHQRNMRWHFH
jgi:hypothetical protein